MTPTRGCIEWWDILVPRSTYSVSRVGCEVSAFSRGGKLAEDKGRSDIGSPPRLALVLPDVPPQIKSGNGRIPHEHEGARWGQDRLEVAMRGSAGDAISNYLARFTQSSAGAAE